MIDRCPGQDLRYLKPDDVYEAACPACGGRVEFFRDDRSRKCPSCGARFRNPGIDLGCAEWCPYASECLDYVPRDEGDDPAPLGDAGRATE
jgi:hypothetical protein